MIISRLRSHLPLAAVFLLTCSSTSFGAKPSEDAGVDPQKLSRSIEVQILTLNVNQISKYVIDFNFSTFHDMYAYRELLLWAQAAPAQQRSELLAVTRIGLEAVVCHSGMGLPIAPGDQAVGLLFDQGLPRYTAMPEPSQPTTLRWDAASFKQQITPRSVGQSLAAKSSYVLADTSDEGRKLRNTLAASALQEFQTLVPLLELDGGKNAGYLPALLKRKDDKWSVLDASSRLYGQMSLIQGLAHLYAMLASSTLDTKTIGDKHVAEWRKEVHRTLEKVYHTTVKHHFDAEAGSLIGSYDRAKGASTRLSASEAGFALEVLANLVGILPKDDPLREPALKLLITQANFVTSTRLEGKPFAPRTFLVKRKKAFAGTLLLLEDQLAIVNGLLAAEQATGNDVYGKTAQAIFQAAREALWSAPTGTFRAAVGHWVTAYDGRVFGMTLAAWRRMEKRLPAGEARKNGDHFIQAVLKQAGLLQAEGPLMGETTQPEAYIHDQLPQLVKSVAPLKRTERSEKIAAAIRTLSDQDGDGVPGTRFAGGRFGAAPVLITQTSVKTPFTKPPADKPSADTPSADTPSADTPSANTPSANTPSGDAPPVATTPAGSTP